MKYAVLISLLGFGSLLCSSCAAERSIPLAIAVGLMGEDGGDKFFYYPTKDQPFTPKKYNYAFDDVYFQTSDEIKLHGWWLPARGERKATVVYSHGNAGSLPHHFVFAYWLVDAGYDVFMYDYRGYGKSEGEVNKKGLVEDAKAAFSYVQSRKDVQKIIGFGHSLGGAKSIAALGLQAPEKLMAVVVDSTFASYADMAERVAGKKAREVVSDSFEPMEYVSKLPAKTPLLIVHGSQDSTIPFEQATKLYAAAKAPKKLLRAEGANHVNSFFIEDNKYRKLLLDWMEQTLVE